MQIKSKDGRHFAVFEINRKTAIEYSNKLETHKFEIEVNDPREKTYEQIKMFWSMLNEFVEFLFGHDIPKEEKEKLKLALYQEYQEEKGIKVSLSKTSVTSCRLFLNWIITKFAEEYSFVPTNIQLQDEFSSSYAYACIVSNSCAICGKQSTPKKFGRKWASICAEHDKVTAKELAKEYHLPLIAIAEETINILKDER